MFHQSLILDLQNWTVQWSETHVEVDKKNPTNKEDQCVSSACFKDQGKKKCEPQSEHSLEHLDLRVSEQNIKKVSWELEQYSAGKITMV